MLAKEVKRATVSLQLTASLGGDLQGQQLWLVNTGEKLTGSECYSVMSALEIPMFYGFCEQQNEPQPIHYF